MKKIIRSTIVMLSFVFMLSACGSTEVESGDVAGADGGSVESNKEAVVTEAPSATDVPSQEPTASPTVEPTEAPTEAPTAEPTKAPAVSEETPAGTIVSPTAEEFLACKFQVPLEMSKIEGLYKGTYSFSRFSNRSMVIYEDKIEVYHHDGTGATYTADQITKDDKTYHINDGSGATITIEDKSIVNSDGTILPNYTYRYSLGDVYYVLQGSLLEVFNGKHLYDISYDYMGEWGCIPVTEVVKEKLLSGLVTDDYRIIYSYKRNMSPDSPYTQQYAINAYDVDGTSSETLWLRVHSTEELAKQEYENLMSNNSYAVLELDGNMVLYARCNNPLSTLDSYNYKSDNLLVGVYGEHCVYDELSEYGGVATYFVNPISLEFGEKLNAANALLFCNLGEYYTEDYSGMVMAGTLYTGYEGSISVRCNLEDYTSIELNSRLITDVDVEGNKIVLVSNDCQNNMAVLAELVFDGNNTIQVNMKAYAGVYDLTIANSSSKTVTAEASFTAKKNY